MSHPQFTLRALLVATLVVGALLATWRALRAPFGEVVVAGDYVRRQYVWRNGLSVTISHDGFEFPSIKIETGVVPQWVEGY